MNRLLTASGPMAKLSGKNASLTKKAIEAVMAPTRMGDIDISLPVRRVMVKAIAMVRAVAAAIRSPRIEPLCNPDQTIIATPNSDMASASQVSIRSISLNHKKDITAAKSGVKARMKTTLAMVVLNTAVIKVMLPVA